MNFSVVIYLPDISEVGKSDKSGEVELHLFKNALLIDLPSSQMRGAQLTRRRAVWVGARKPLATDEFFRIQLSVDPTHIKTVR